MRIQPLWLQHRQSEFFGGRFDGGSGEAATPAAHPVRGGKNPGDGDTVGGVEGFQGRNRDVRSACVEYSHSASG